MNYCELTDYKDQRAILLKNNQVEAKFLPDQGGKLASLIAGGREYLVQRPEKKYRRSNFGDSYVDGECSGMDDMFPTIDVCGCENEPWRGTQLADHGEIWSQKMHYEMKGEAVEFEGYGVKLPYRFQKKVYFSNENTLHFDYCITNLSSFELDFIWAAHTMLKGEPGTRIRVPEGADRAIAIFSNRESFGKYGEEFPYPEFIDRYGEKRNLSIMESPENESEKFYFKEPLRQGWCGADFPDGRSLTMRFPQDRIPYLGILMNRGGFMDIYNLFLEPCSAPFDRPDLARAFKKNSVLKGHSKFEWYLEMEINNN